MGGSLYDLRLTLSQIFGSIDTREDEISKVDVSTSSPQQLTTLTGHDTVDYNSWQESEKGLRLASSLDKDTVIVEGMFEPGHTATNSIHGAATNLRQGTRSLTLGGSI